MQISLANTFSYKKNNDLQEYLLSLSEQLYYSESFLFACVQHTFCQNKRIYACVVVIFNQKTKFTWSDTPVLILGLFRFLEGLDGGTRIIFQKREKMSLMNGR